MVDDELRRDLEATIKLADEEWQEMFDPDDEHMVEYPVHVATAILSHFRVAVSLPPAPPPQDREETGTELELFVAGVISTFPPFDHQHPSGVLPIAKAVLGAISEWHPSDDEPLPAVLPVKETPQP